MGYVRQRPGTIVVFCGQSMASAAHYRRGLAEPAPIGGILLSAKAAKLNGRAEFSRLRNVSRSLHVSSREALSSRDFSCQWHWALPGAGWKPDPWRVAQRTVIMHSKKGEGAQFLFSATRPISPQLM